MKNLILIYLVCFSVLFSNSQSVQGKWFGIIELMGTQTEIGLEITEVNDTLRGFIFNPEKPKGKLKTDFLDLTEDSMFFEVNKLRMSFSGRINQDKIQGVFSQSGRDIPLIFARARSIKKEIKRPQTPEPPFSYHTEELTINNKEQNVSLSGTLTLPINDGKKYPVVVLISGSGPQDRNSEILKHKSFAVIADHLAKKGIGSFRYDDRGTAKSTGNYLSSDLSNFYSDLDAVVKSLKSRSEVDKLGLIGHSEGGILAPWYASEHPKEIDFVIMLAGPGIAVTEMMHLQREFEYNKLGMTSEQIQQQKGLFHKIDSIVINYEGVEKTEKLTTFLTNYLTNQGLKGKDLEKNLAVFMKDVDRAWYKSFVEINPEEYLKNLKCPILALGGLKDFQVPTEINFEGIKRYKKKKFFRKSNLTMISYPNLNHLFQPCTTGGAEEYGEIETTFDRQVLFDMSDFINSL